MWKRRTNSPGIFLFPKSLSFQIPPQLPGWTGIRLGTGTSLGGWWGQSRWRRRPFLDSCFSDDLGILELTNFTHKCFHDIRCSIPYITWQPKPFRWLVFGGTGSIVFWRFEAKFAVRKGKTKQLREGWALDLLGLSLGNEFDLCKVREE